MLDVQANEEFKNEMLYATKHERITIKRVGIGLGGFVAKIVIHR